MKPRTLLEKIIAADNGFIRELVDLSGWKRDWKKITGVLIAIVVVAFVALLVAKKDWGLRWHAPLEFVQYQKSETDSFEFSFSKRFVLDTDEKKKYGADYIAGFHLAQDQRTGCDVRMSPVGINFAKKDSEISAAIEKDLQSHVKGFSNFAAQRVKLDGETAFEVSFDLIDPLSNVLHIQQAMASHAGKDYLIVCGAGKGQYALFEKDFAAFTDSFDWK